MKKSTYEHKILMPQDINKLKDYRIYLYGAGGMGKFFKELLEQDYDDIWIIGFIDSFKDGVFEGLKVFKFDDYEHLDGNMIIVTSYFQEEICDALSERGINDYFITESFWLTHYMFSPSEQKQKKEDVDKILSFLFSEKDKALYNFFFKARSYDSGLSKTKYLEAHGTTVMALNDPADLMKEFPEHTRKQYLDFVKTDPIKTVVQAGVYDGSDILEISNCSPRLELVYGFEPSGSKYFLPQMHDLVKEKRLSLKLLPFMIKKQPLIFFPAKAGSYISDKMVPVQDTCVVETISLDEYCALNNINQVDFICCDIEDAEIQFLLGAENIIKKSRPQLAISIYHSKSQFIEIPLLLNRMLENYIFRVGHYSNTLNETTIYAIPEEIGQ